MKLSGVADAEKLHDEVITARARLRDAVCRPFPYQCGCGFVDPRVYQRCGSERNASRSTAVLRLSAGSGAFRLMGLDVLRLRA